MPEETCPICHRTLHSIITRRIGNYGVCLDCGDSLGPLVMAIADSLVQRAITATSNGGINIRQFTRLELADNFVGLIVDADATSLAKRL